MKELKHSYCRCRPQCPSWDTMTVLLLSFIKVAMGTMAFFFYCEYNSLVLFNFFDSVSVCLCLSFSFLFLCWYCCCWHYYKCEHRLCICLRVHVCDWCVLLHQGFALQNDLRSIKYKSYQLFLLLQYEELVYVVFFCYCNLKSFLRHIPFGGRGAGGYWDQHFRQLCTKMWQSTKLLFTKQYLPLLHNSLDWDL